MVPVAQAEEVEVVEAIADVVGATAKVAAEAGRGGGEGEGGGSGDGGGRSKS